MWWILRSPSPVAWLSIFEYEVKCRRSCSLRTNTQSRVNNFRQQRRLRLLHVSAAKGFYHFLQGFVVHFGMPLSQKLNEWMKNAFSACENEITWRKSSSAITWGLSAATITMRVMHRWLISLEDENDNWLKRLCPAAFYRSNQLITSCLQRI